MTLCLQNAVSIQPRIDVPQSLGYLPNLLEPPLLGQKNSYANATLYFHICVHDHREEHVEHDVDVEEGVGDKPQHRDRALKWFNFIKVKRLVRLHHAEGRS